eukprot:MONOS_6319.1-p1 / transcript=MONOS_6319.1 / gene=MONOS_6319 / organism=Monocercomonoides_exilis_PA203 / gene_product=unspecified product / transcript_product=unspecified product / location=Mono_scaffold00197:58486-63114(+) / protein_length=1467 / sequence_SO=supercontig / SO=protein_coding / is_pseudo=false
MTRQICFHTCTFFACEFLLLNAKDENGNCVDGYSSDVTATPVNDLCNGGAIFFSTIGSQQDTTAACETASWLINSDASTILLNVSFCMFVLNEATSNGGAIAAVAEKGGSSISVVLNGCLLVSSTAENGIGGALWIEGLKEDTNDETEQSRGGCYFCAENCHIANGKAAKQGAGAAIRYANHLFGFNYICFNVTFTTCLCTQSNDGALLLSLSKGTNILEFGNVLLECFFISCIPENTESEGTLSSNIPLSSHSSTANGLSANSRVCGVVIEDEADFSPEENIFTLCFSTHSNNFVYFSRTDTSKSDWILSRQTEMHMDYISEFSVDKKFCGTSNRLTCSTIQFAVSDAADDGSFTKLLLHEPCWSDMPIYFGSKFIEITNAPGEFGAIVFSLVQGYCDAEVTSGSFMAHNISMDLSGDLMNYGLGSFIITSGSSSATSQPSSQSNSFSFGSICFDESWVQGIHEEWYDGCSYVPLFLLHGGVLKLIHTTFEHFLTKTVLFLVQPLDTTTLSTSSSISSADEHSSQQHNELDGEQESSSDIQLIFINTTVSMVTTEGVIPSVISNFPHTSISKDCYDLSPTSLCDICTSKVCLYSMNSIFGYCTANSSICGGAIGLYEDTSHSVEFHNTTFLNCKSKVQSPVRLKSDLSRGGALFLYIGDPLGAINGADDISLNHFLFHEMTFEKNNAEIGRDLFLVVPSCELLSLDRFDWDMNFSVFNTVNSVFCCLGNDRLGTEDIDVLEILLFFIGQTVFVNGATGADNRICGREEAPCATLNCASLHVPSAENNLNILSERASSNAEQIAQIQLFYRSSLADECNLKDVSLIGVSSAIQSKCIPIVVDFLSTSALSIAAMSCYDSVSISSLSFAFDDVTLPSYYVLLYQTYGFLELKKVIFSSLDVNQMKQHHCVFCQSYGGVVSFSEVNVSFLTGTCQCLFFTECPDVVIDSSQFSALSAVINSLISNEQTLDQNNSNKLCSWNTGIILSQSSRVSMLNTTLSNSSVGGVAMNGGSLFVKNGEFLHNNPLIENCPSARRNVFCNESGVLEIESLKGGDGLKEDSSLWMLSDGCTLEGIAAERASSLFMPTLTSVSGLIEEDLIQITVIGSCIIPCELKFQIDSEEFMKRNRQTFTFSEFISETSAKASVPMSLFSESANVLHLTITLVVGESQTQVSNPLYFNITIFNASGNSNSQSDILTTYLKNVLIICSSCVFVFTVIISAILIVAVTSSRKKKRERKVNIENSGSANQTQPAPIPEDTNISVDSTTHSTNESAEDSFDAVTLDINCTNTTLSSQKCIQKKECDISSQSLSFLINPKPLTSVTENPDISSSESQSLQSVYVDSSPPESHSASSASLPLATSASAAAPSELFPLSDTCQFIHFIPSATTLAQVTSSVFSCSLSESNQDPLPAQQSMCNKNPSEASFSQLQDEYAMEPRFQQDTSAPFSLNQMRMDYSTSQLFTDNFRSN